MISINSNIASLNAQRNLSRTQGDLNGNYGRLSSGLRINSAADDAAGLAISERLKSQIRSMSQAERNANDGISLVQTAEGAMNEVTGILTRIRELAIQSSNGTLGTSERTYLDQERTALTSEIDRIASVTNFNGKTLLSGGAAGTQFDFQVGIFGTSNDVISVNISDMSSAVLSGGGLSTLDLTTQSSAQSALSVLDGAIDAVAAARADLGAAQNRMNVAIANVSNARENLSAANSRIRDVDVANETSEMARNNILMQSGVAVLSQANQMPQYAAKLIGG